MDVLVLSVTCADQPLLYAKALMCQGKRGPASLTRPGRNATLFHGTIAHETPVQPAHSVLPCLRPRGRRRAVVLAVVAPGPPLRRASDVAVSRAPSRGQG